jgi:phage shock protein C
MKKLKTSEEDSVFFGVCGGMGEYFEVDPIVYRLIFIFSVLIFGFIEVFLAYIILSFLMD